MSLDLLIDCCVASSQVQHGRPTRSLPSALFGGQTRVVSQSPRWTKEELEFIVTHLGRMSDAEIARSLGRTEVAVHLKWSRDMHLPAPSKHPDFLTGHQAARLVGLDGHKITHWCDAGLIPHHLTAGPRKMRLIPKVSFYRWITSPESWITSTGHASRTITYAGCVSCDPSAGAMNGGRPPRSPNITEPLPGMSRRRSTANPWTLCRCPRRSVAGIRKPPG